ncbi:MAG TPA: MurR/RpiR family transcriptional regulator [Candidatus Anaerostipes avistercoris]|uniref:MurR/RpiR family transcriptional regulator n=1 Tax=Candidatus Anaerostipes avistercoris TaxID=2838462 RepID=A0A9D2PIJ1_9FIRM|nr:MurR/RpiR family transcriptional regulator [Candidatus Anaerostipes avistercoris]
MKEDAVKDADRFSKSEKKLHRYICSHLDEIRHMTIRELAGKAETYPNTVVRYYKKLGYEGFTEFKSSIQNDLKELSYDDFTIHDSEQVIHTVNKIEALYQNVIKETKQKLSVSHIQKILKEMNQRKYVDFIVYDANEALAEYASHYFFSTGKICNVYTSVDEQIYFAMNAEPEEHLVFMISRSGASKRMVKVAKIMNVRGIFTVLFSQSKKTVVSSYCTETVTASYVHSFKKLGDCMFYTSVKYLLDCIIGSYYASNYDETLENVEDYRKEYLGAETSKKNKKR